MGLRLGAVCLGSGRAYELKAFGLRAEGVGLGLKVGAVYLGLGRAYELKAFGLRAAGLGLRVGAV